MGMGKTLLAKLFLNLAKTLRQQRYFPSFSFSLFLPKSQNEEKIFWKKYIMIMPIARPRPHHGHFVERAGKLCVGEQNRTKQVFWVLGSGWHPCACRVNRQKAMFPLFS
jgi:hypothetical protein